MSPPSDTDLRLIRAIRRRWPNPDERAEQLGLSTRQLRRWELDGDIPKIIEKLLDLGVLIVADELPTDPDQPPA